MKTYGHDLQKMTPEALQLLLDVTRGVVREQGTHLTVAERGLCEAILREMQKRGIESK